MGSSLSLNLTIVSVENVNGDNGDRNPYAVVWIVPPPTPMLTEPVILPDRPHIFKLTRPVENEAIPLSGPLQGSILTIEIHHSNPSDKTNSLVGSLRIPLGALPHPEDATQIRTFPLLHQGNISLKLAFLDTATQRYLNSDPYCSMNYPVMRSSQRDSPFTDPCYLNSDPYYSMNYPVMSHARESVPEDQNNPRSSQRVSAFTDEFYLNSYPYCSMNCTTMSYVGESVVLEDQNKEREKALKALEALEHDLLMSNRRIRRSFFVFMFVFVVCCSLSLRASS